MHRSAQVQFVTTFAAIFCVAISRWQGELWLAAGLVLLAISLLGQYRLWRRLERQLIEQIAQAYIQRH